MMALRRVWLIRSVPAHTTAFVMATTASCSTVSATDVEIAAGAVRNLTAAGIASLFG